MAEWERRLTGWPRQRARPAAAGGLEGFGRRLFPVGPSRRWWDSLTFWRGLAAAGVLAAVIAVAPRLALPPEAADMNFAAIPRQAARSAVDRGADR